MKIEEAINTLNTPGKKLFPAGDKKAEIGFDQELVAFLHQCRNQFTLVPVDEQFFLRYKLQDPEAGRLQATLLQLRKKKEAQIKARDYAHAATLREKELALYRQLYALLFPSEKLFVQLDDKTIGVKWNQAGARSILQHFPHLVFKRESHSDKPDVRQE